MSRINIGDGWTKAVKSASTNKELFDVYEKNLPLISKLFKTAIKKHLLKEVAVADFGGGIGSLTDEIKKTAPKELKISCTCFDTNTDLLQLNQSADFKVCTDLKNPLGKDAFDIGLMRYVLNYNTKTDQLKILKNIHKSLKSSGTLINWWCGVSNTEHQKKFQILFGKKDLSRALYRPNSYWTTWNENKEMFEQAGFQIKIIKEYTLPIKHLYKVRYKLTATENEKILTFLGEYAFISYVIFAAQKKAS